MREENSVFIERVNWAEQVSGSGNGGDYYGRKDKNGPVFEKSKLYNPAAECEGKIRDAKSVTSMYLKKEMESRRGPRMAYQEALEAYKSLLRDSRHKNRKKLMRVFESDLRGIERVLYEANAIRSTDRYFTSGQNAEEKK